MKNILKYLAVATLAVSCVNDKEFLTEHPKNIYTIDNAYGSSDQVVATLASAYTNIMGQYYGAVDKGAQTDLYGASSIMGGPGANTIGSWSTGQGKSLWDMHYKDIAYANQALYAAELPQITWNTEQEKMQLQAEARFIRGFSYLRLAEYFGGVPLVDEYTTTLRFDYERASRKATYECALDDLAFAYEYLPQHADIGRPGKGAASLLLAEAYLALGVEDSASEAVCWNKAAEYAQKTIDLHPLMTRRFGCRADKSDKGVILGVPNYNPDGTAYSDLFYRTNPRLAENTEAIWVVLGGTSYTEVNNYTTSGSSPLRTASSMMSAPALRDVTLIGSAEKPWQTGSAVSPFYQGPGGSTDSPAIVPNGIPISCCPTWFVQVQMFDDEHNNGSSLLDARWKEGVAKRSKFPVTNPNHPRYSVEVYYGTDERMCGWEDVDKGNTTTAMEFSTVYDKVIPVDAWAYDPDNYFVNQTIYRDYYVFRSAEAYLLLAEAQLRAGDKEKAAAALNAVRERSSALPFAADAVDIHTILDERARELVFEEDRWATFLRMEPSVWKERLYAYGLWSYHPGAKLNPQAKLFPETQQFSSWTGTLAWDLWPIPLDYIDLNTDNPAGMQQNPGWNAD